MSEIGITAYGAYIPRLRMSRESIAVANMWANPILMAYGASERSMCDYDEDSVTMAVEAVRNCLPADERTEINNLYFASTTAPFADRQHSAIIAEALNLSEEVSNLDVACSQRGGTSALIAALKGLNGEGGRTVVVASDHRLAKSAGINEVLFGDGAAAVALGRGNVAARFLGSITVSRDMVHHHRGCGSKYDYSWEERWIRDEGYLKIVPVAVQGLIQKTGVKTAEIDHFIMPSLIRGVGPRLAKTLGIPPEAVRDTLMAGCGDTGAAHALVMLVDALEDAQPGQKILVVGFGQGADALLFETTDELLRLKRGGFKSNLANGVVEKNYPKFLSLNKRVEMDWGIRAEDGPRRVRLTSLYRNRKMLTGFCGGKCSNCGTVQFPKSQICVNPECRSMKSQADFPLADEPAMVSSYTVDWLSYCPHPPFLFGMVEFDNGAKMMMEYACGQQDDMAVGRPLKMVFRVRRDEELRNLKTYFWKAVPVDNGAKEE